MFDRIRKPRDEGFEISRAAASMVVHGMTPWDADSEAVKIVLRREEEKAYLPPHDPHGTEDDE